MLKTMSLANAITMVMAVLYAIRAGLAVLVPDFLTGLAQIWMRGLNLEVSKATTPLTWGDFFIGILAAAILTWVVTYVTANVYNFLAHRELEAEKHHKGYAAA